MRNFIIFFLIIMVICFITPNLFLRDVLVFENIEIKDIVGFFKNKLMNVDDDKLLFNDTKNDLDKLKNVEKIKLLLKEENKVIELGFDDYIKGVLIGEMPIEYELEALKAQALVARTYTLYKLKNAENIHENADICDDINCCQCYKTKEYAYASWDDEAEVEKWNKVEQAVNETRNYCITYNDEIIAAFFHANSGGKTEDVKYLWGGEEIPYLQSVTSFEEELDKEEKIFDKTDFEKIIKEQYEKYNYEKDEIKVNSRTVSGRVADVTFGEFAIDATKLRKILELKSTNFEIEKVENGIKITTIGYGHGVGMSQVGANQMAKEGKNFEEIIKHYYTGVDVSEMIAENNRLVYNYSIKMEA